MRHTLLGLLALVVFCAPGAARAETAPARVPSPEEVDCAIRLTPYALQFVDQALEAQAWVVLNAAHELAQANGGAYPASVADFVAQLPRGERMENLLTGKRNVPSDDIGCPYGAIIYRPVTAGGQVVACEVVVPLLNSDDVLTLSSDAVWSTIPNDIALNDEPRP